MSLPVPAATGVFSTHQANCHCGAIRLSFKISPPLASYPVVSCNCSICQRNGYMFVYPDKDNVTFESSSGGGGGPGQEESQTERSQESTTVLGSYTFGNEVISHKFCKRCGSSVFFEFADGGPPAVGAEQPALPNIVGVNVRMITGLEPDELIVNKVEYMRDFGPKYTT